MSQGKNTSETEDKSEMAAHSFRKGYNIEKEATLFKHINNVMEITDWEKKFHPKREK